MKTLLSACLFLTLLCSVSSGTGPDVCWRCLNWTCSTKFDKCPPGARQKTCYSKVVEFPWENTSENQEIARDLGCMRRQECHPVRYTATLPDDGYIYMEVKCCNKNFCNILLTQQNSPLNGMKCPGCRTSNTNESCSSDTTVSCRGKENKCISYTGSMYTKTHTYPYLSFKGCATRNLCDLLSGASKEGSDLLKPTDTREAECSPADLSADNEVYPEK